MHVSDQLAGITTLTQDLATRVPDSDDYVGDLQDKEQKQSYNRYSQDIAKKIPKLTQPLSHTPSVAVLIANQSTLQLSCLYSPPASCQVFIDASTVQRMVAVSVKIKAHYT